MSLFTATVSPSGSFVTLTVSDLTQDSLVTITRDPSPGGIVVRGTPVELPAAGATVLTDLEFGYGVPTTYTAELRDPTSGTVVETLTAQVDAVPLGTSGMVISDPLTNRQVLVDVHDQNSERSEFRGYRYDLAGRSTPLYLLEEHAGWRWTLVVRTDTVTERDQLDGLLRHRSPVLLRVSAGCDLREGWVVPETIDVTRQAITATNPGRIWSVQVGQVQAPDSTVEGVAVTLQDLHDYEPTTLQTLSTRQPTLVDLSLAVVDHAG